MPKDLAGGSGVFATPVEESIDVDLGCLGVRFPVRAEALRQMITQSLTRPPDVEDCVFAHAPFWRGRAQPRAHGQTFAHGVDLPRAAHIEAATIPVGISPRRA